MSWFSELTSKAEAMLVKLDQDAAEALQHPDRLLRANKIIDQAVNSLSNYTGETANEETEPLDTRLENQGRENDSAQNPTLMSNNVSSQSIRLSNNIDVSSSEINQPYASPNDTSLSDNNFTTEQVNSTSGPQDTDNNVEMVKKNSLDLRDHPMVNPLSERPNHSQPTKKFTIQTSKSRLRNFAPEKRLYKGTKVTKNLYDSRDNEVQTPPKPESSSPVVSPGADDIRASINRSLQEYTLKKTQRNETNSSLDSDQASYFSHYDSQPNLAQHSHLLETNYVNDLNSNRLHSHPSFSIDVPDERLDSSSSQNDIATRLLKQNALKKKSTLYLHKVINRLASPNSRSDAIISDQMKIRLRRIQMRVGSYGRRLNYYFRTYPNLKYVMLIYLVLMQMLVIYVLFFYQSSSSTSDLSSQIKQQQQEMLEVKYE